MGWQSGDNARRSEQRPTEYETWQMPDRPAGRAPRFDPYTQDPTTELFQPEPPSSPYPPQWPPPPPPPPPRIAPARRRRRWPRMLILIGVVLVLLACLATRNPGTSTQGPQVLATGTPRATATKPASTATPVPPTATPTPPLFAIDLPFNNVGISSDANPGTGNYDYFGNAYSAQALKAAGLAPGSIYKVNGFTFTWPNVAPGSPDNVLVQNQTIEVRATRPLAAIGFLGASNFFPTQNPLTLTFTDGSSQSAPLGLSEWTLVLNAQYGNQIVATMAYYNNAQGKQTKNVYVFFTMIPLPTNKTLRSITLPQPSAVHIFAISAHG